MEEEEVKRRSFIQAALAFLAVPAAATAIKRVPEVRALEAVPPTVVSREMMIKGKLLLDLKDACPGSIVKIEEDWRYPGLHTVHMKIGTGDGSYETHHLVDLEEVNMKHLINSFQVAYRRVPYKIRREAIATKYYGPVV